MKKLSECEKGYRRWIKPETAKEVIAQLERENAELVKFIEQCSEDRYARVACLEWVRKRKGKHE